MNKQASHLHQNCNKMNPHGEMNVNDLLIRENDGWASVEMTNTFQEGWTLGPQLSAEFSKDLPKLI